MSPARLSSRLRIEFDTFGSPADPALLLIMGFGAQLIAWPAPFCERLAVAGRFVIRYDHCDCGLSSKLDGEPADLDAVIAAASTGDLDRARSLSPYTLSDLADDGLGLLSALRHRPGARRGLVDGRHDRPDDGD